MKKVEVTNACMTRPLTRRDIVRMCAELRALAARDDSSRGGSSSSTSSSSTASTASTADSFPHAIMDEKNGVVPSLAVNGGVTVELRVAGGTASTQWHAAGKLPFQEWDAPEHADEVVLAVDADVQKYKNGRVTVSFAAGSWYKNPLANVGALAEIFRRYGVQCKASAAGKGRKRPNKNNRYNKFNAMADGFDNSADVAADNRDDFRVSKYKVVGGTEEERRLLQLNLRELDVRGCTVILRKEDRDTIDLDTEYGKSHAACFARMLQRTQAYQAADN